MVAGKSGGAPEAVQDGVTGLLVDPQSIQEIAAAIHRLRDDAALRKQLGDAGRARALRDFVWRDRWHQFASSLDFPSDVTRYTRQQLRSFGGQALHATRYTSIIIPVHNHTVELAACLASLKRQTFQDFEIIIVDDGSDVPIAGANARFEKNRGAPAARNEGFRHARGKFVMFLDADAILIPRALERLRAALDEHPETAFAYSAFDYGWKRFASRPFDARALKKQNYIHTSALIRREWFFGFDETLKKFQDWDLWLTIAERGGVGAFVPECLMRFATRRGGMSRWLPSFVHRLPWPIFGWMPKELARYRAAENIIRKKHGI